MENLKPKLNEEATIEETATEEANALAQYLSERRRLLKEYVATASKRLVWFCLRLVSRRIKSVDEELRQLDKYSLGYLYFRVNEINGLIETLSPDMHIYDRSEKLPKGLNNASLKRQISMISEFLATEAEKPLKKRVE